MTNVERLHAMLSDACFGASGDALANDLAQYLAHYEIDEDDREALLAGPRRLGLYRQLVRHNVIDVIGVMLERTKARIETRAPGSFGRAVDGFLAEQGPKTPHLRDVPGEFLAWAAPKWRADASLPTWLVDYAELELVEFTIGVAPRPAPEGELLDVTADRVLVFAHPRRLVSFAFAVHEIATDDVAGGPAARPVELLVYRDGEHRVRFLELSPLAAAILARLFDGLSLKDAMIDACRADAHVLDDSVLAGAAQLLADLGERGVLLGARASA